MAKDKEEVSFVTFGQSHVHVIGQHRIDKDCVAKISGGRDAVFDMFGKRFFTSYEDEDMINMQYFPRGVIDLT